MIPKFRAWDSINDRWINEWYDFFINDNGMLYINRENKEIRGTEIVPMDNLEYMTVCMSTGLKDKNGVEIYEGDIILDYKKVTRNKKTTMVEDYWEVYYKKEYGQFLLRSANKVRHLSFAVGLEISGNTFEHPHLLEEQNK